MRELNKEEASQLLYLETRAVDYGGRVDERHMNRDDFKITIKWDKEGFLYFGRIRSNYFNSNGRHWVKFTNEAFEVAAYYRKERALRMLKNRKYKRTDELD